MVIIVNGVGFLMMLIAAGLAAGILAVFGIHSSHVAGIVASIFALLFDLGYREARKSTLFGRAGGRLFFLPLWLMATVGAIASLVGLFI